MKNLAYYNGAIGELTEMSVPFCDRVCFFGDGVYDATYARNYKIFTLEEHLERLYRSAERVHIQPPIAIDDLLRLTHSLVTRCDYRETLVYIQFTRGITAPRNHVFAGGTSSLWITVTPKKITPREKIATLVSVPDTRYDLCDVKTLNLLPNVLNAAFAAQKGCDEGVFFEEDGTVNECAHSNVHILQNGVLVSPPAGKKVLGGIARNHLISACHQIGIPVCERHFTIREMLSADEAYITSAGTLLTPCSCLDGQKIGGKAAEKTRLLQDLLYGEFYDATN